MYLVIEVNMIENLTRRRKIRFIKKAREKRILSNLRILNSTYETEYIKLDKPIPTSRIGFEIIIKPTALNNLRYSHFLDNLKECVKFLNTKFKYDLTYREPKNDWYYYSYFNLNETQYNKLSNDEKIYFIKSYFLEDKIYRLDLKYGKHLTYKSYKIKIDRVQLLDRQKESLRKKLRIGWYNGDYYRLKKYKRDKWETKINTRRKNQDILEGIEEYYLYQY